MFEADADPLNGMRCPLHFAQRHYQRNNIKQHTGRFEDIGAIDAP